MQPPEPPVRIDEDSRIETTVDERIEKHVHTSQNILKRQQQFIKQSTTETIRFTPTPPPQSPLIEFPITPIASPIPPVEPPPPRPPPPAPPKPSPPPPARVTSPPPPQPRPAVPPRAKTPPKEPARVPQRVDDLPVAPRAIPDPPAPKHTVHTDSVQTFQQQTQITRKQEIRTVVSHQQEQKHLEMRRTEFLEQNLPHSVKTSSPPPPLPELPPVRTQVSLFSQLKAMLLDSFIPQIG